MFEILDLIGSYDLSNKTIELRGSALALEQLAKCLNMGINVVCALKKIEPTSISHIRCLTQLEICISESTVLISIQEQTLKLVGSSKMLNYLSVSVENLYGLKSAKFSSLHSHIEYFPDHPYLASTSLPLVIYLLIG